MLNINLVDFLIEELDSQEYVYIYEDGKLIARGKVERLVNTQIKKLVEKKTVSYRPNFTNKSIEIDVERDTTQW